MPFERIPGCDALVFTPEESPRSEKKHNCKDCFSCQWCSDDRCKLCLKRKSNKCCKHRKK